MSEILDLQIKKLEEKEKIYINSSSEKDKQDYWNQIFCENWWHSESEIFPINLSEFKKQNFYLEKDFEKFIPWIILALEEIGFSWDIKDIFIFDKETKVYLDNESEKINKIINLNNNIEWIGLNSEELAEKVWDLFYDSLAWFLLTLSNKVKEKYSEAWKYLKDASSKINNAWNICSNYVWEWFSNPKHSNIIKQWESNENIINKIINFNHTLLKKFLLDLSNKIFRDWDSDSKRGREKLSLELFEASKNIELAGKSL